jgi:hypothetical protein
MLPSVLERHPERVDQTKALSRAVIERQFARRHVLLREKTLWWMLCETAARPGLALDMGRPISVGDEEPSARWARNHPPGEPAAAQPLPASASASAVLASCLGRCPCPVRSWELMLRTGRTNL